MKIIIDECLPVRLKNYLDEFEVLTVNDLGWKSMKNGKLLNAACENNFDVFLTIDKKLKNQQNLRSFNIAVVVFDVQINKIETISPLLTKLKKILPTIKKGTITVIS